MKEVIQASYSDGFIKIKIDYIRLIMNSLVLIINAVLVSLEIHIYLVSAVALLLFILINIKYIKSILTGLIKRKI